MAEMQRDHLSPLAVSDSPVEKFREFLEIRGEKLTEPSARAGASTSSIRTSTSTPTSWSATCTTPAIGSAGRRSTGRLRLLVEAGLLRELRLTNRSAFEHDYGYPAHDHLHCTSCNRVVEFRNDEILKLRDAISLAHGFRPTGHRFLIAGVCSACSRVPQPRRRLDLI